MHSNSTQTQAAAAAAAAAVAAAAAAAVPTSTTANQGSTVSTAAPAHRKNVISCVSVQDSDNEERSSSKVISLFN